MLTKVNLSNFVHFRDEQIFEFTEGSFFLIGSNRSGKSSVFEAIRRCMSTSKNFFFSTSHDRKIPLIVICEYSDKPKTKIYSCYISVQNEDTGLENMSRTIAIKVYFEKDDSSNPIKHLAVDLLKNNSAGYPVNLCYKLVNGTSHLPNIQKPEAYLSDKEITIESIATFVENYVLETKQYENMKKKIVQDYNGETPCEMSLKLFIDNQIVITDPMRSISPVQWTKSKKLDIVQRTRQNVDFSKEMEDRSEILVWYFNEDISNDEKRKVKETFDILTNESGIKFEKEGDNIVVVDNGNTVSLEKAPEGIFEAMVCSILLSIHEFKTVCLEEPGRGMHMLMIERLRDLILKKIKDKTVIIITHIPTFLSSWNIENIFFFKGSDTKDPKSIFAARKGGDIFEESKTKRIITNSTMATIFFVQRVLLVEGESDLIFMTELKAILLENVEIVQDIFSKKVQNTFEKFYQFISSLHILPLQGEQNKLRLEKVCRALQFERYFLLDYDAVVRKIKEEDTCTKFLQDFNLQEDEDLTEDTIKEDVSVLQKAGIFVWKRELPPGWKKSKLIDVNGGTIEYSLYGLCQIDEELNKIFKDNHSELKMQTKRKPDGTNKTFISKLFKKKELTDGNIRKVVLKVIGTALVKKESDVFRLLKFLVDSFENVNQTHTESLDDV